MRDQTPDSPHSNLRGCLSTLLLYVLCIVVPAALFYGAKWLFEID